jgi:hypothetical protein
MGMTVVPILMKKSHDAADSETVEFLVDSGAVYSVVDEEGDSNLLGATTLEALELVLDPFKRELRPMTLALMDAAPFR